MNGQGSRNMRMLEHIMRISRERAYKGNEKIMLRSPVVCLELTIVSDQLTACCYSKDLHLLLVTKHGRIQRQIHCRKKKDFAVKYPGLKDSITSCPKIPQNCSLFSDSFCKTFCFALSPFSILQRFLPVYLLHVKYHFCVYYSADSTSPMFQVEFI